MTKHDKGKPHNRELANLKFLMNVTALRTMAQYRDDSVMYNAIIHRGALCAPMGYCANSGTAGAGANSGTIKHSRMTA